MNPLHTRLSRRSVLSLAVLTGAFVALQPAIAQAVIRFAPSGPIPDKLLLSIGPGAGVIRQHSEVHVRALQPA